METARKIAYLGSGRACGKKSQRSKKDKEGETNISPPFFSSGGGKDMELGASNQRTSQLMEMF